VDSSNFSGFTLSTPVLAFLLPPHLIQPSTAASCILNSWCVASKSCRVTSGLSVPLVSHCCTPSKSSGPTAWKLLWSPSTVCLASLSFFPQFSLARPDGTHVGTYFILDGTYFVS
jgi:hypothetical protein